MHFDENALQNAHGSADGGLDELPRFGGGLAKNMSTRDSTDKVMSTGRGVTRDLGARAPARDSHVRSDSHGQTRVTPTAADLDSTHGAKSGKFDDISDYSDLRIRQAWQLQKEISKLQHEIKTLSARRSRSVRADIAEMLSDTSRSGEMSVEHEPSYNVPLRTALNEGEDRRKDHPSFVVRDNQPVSVCVNDNVNVNLSGGPKQPRETVLRNKAVRVTDPALRVPFDATDVTPGCSNNSNNNLSANTAGADATQRKQLKFEKHDGVSTPVFF